MSQFNQFQQRKIIACMCFSFMLLMIFNTEHTQSATHMQYMMKTNQQRPLKQWNRKLHQMTQRRKYETRKLEGGRDWKWHQAAWKVIAPNTFDLLPTYLLTYLPTYLLTYLGGRDWKWHLASWKVIAPNTFDLLPAIQAARHTRRTGAMHTLHDKAPRFCPNIHVITHNRTIHRNQKWKNQTAMSRLEE